VPDSEATRCPAPCWDAVSPLKKRRGQGASARSKHARLRRAGSYRRGSAPARYPLRLPRSHARGLNKCPPSGTAPTTGRAPMYVSAPPPRTQEGHGGSRVVFLIVAHHDGSGDYHGALPVERVVHGGGRRDRWPVSQVSQARLNLHETAEFLHQATEISTPHHRKATDFLHHTVPRRAFWMRFSRRERAGGV
jgi:hypothetical protein